MPKTLPVEQYNTLIQSEERFRTLFAKSTDAVQLLDEAGHIIYSSDSVKNVLGYDPSEVLGLRPLDYAHPDDLPEFKRQYARLLKKEGVRIDVEYRVLHKNGSWVWLEATIVNHLQNPVINALVGNFRNITKRKEIERALAESEARLRFMAESMPQKIFTADAKGFINYFNPQWSEYTGIPIGKIRPETFGEILHPNDYEENIKTWNQSIATGDPFVYEHRFRAANGKYRWHLTRARPMRDAKGNIISWLGSSTDIDDIKQAQRRQQRLERQKAVLTEQRRQLVEINKAKDEFISLASHQLRTPATGVKQYLAMILEGYASVPVPDEIRSMIEIAYESNERQLKIVDDLLKVAYVDAGKIRLEEEKYDMVRLLKDVVREHDSVIRGRKQKVAWANKPSQGTVYIDVHLMRMVLENIIDNASKYSPEGKTITLDVEATKKHLIVSIKDEGVGIGEEDCKNLFKKFSRIDNPLSAIVGGTGLGLYWAKQVIELHKGKIAVKSEVGKGSTFTIKIPLAQQTTAKAAD
ncbi:MAG: hypothetical protein JWP13_399 [Candidatus Saccharibacteria bacterium]|nr:hypothetical protein [Candidatus Saccharibacteria bacterium]